jgi:type VI secretion system protein VasJ
VLGIGESDQNWRWAAFGKHPVARDFFRVGPDFPLIKGFSDWVENGYQILTSKKKTFHGLCSWRFWARGSQKESLACGLVKDSSDSLGRPYPLLIMGIGPLNGWEDHWDLLPFACERTWDQIEYLSAQMFNDFKIFESEINKLRPPLPEWSEFIMKRGDLKELGLISNSHKTTQNLGDLKKQALSLSEKTESFIGLDQGMSNDQFTSVSFWHLLFKNEVKVIPNVFFMGGTLEKAYLAVFRRPLMPTDFIQLWSISV